MKTNFERTLRALAAETAEAEASAEVRRTLLTELAGRRKSETPAWRVWSWRLWPVAAAACLVAGFWFGTNRKPEVASSGVVPVLATPAVVEAGPPAEVAVAPVEAVEPSVRQTGRTAGARGGVGYAVVTPWYFHSGLPAPATGRVVRMDVSAATAQQFGVLVSGKTADAEILMGDDGLARAIRFLQPVRRNQVVRASSRQE